MKGINFIKKKMIQKIYNLRKKIKFYKNNGKKFQNWNIRDDIYLMRLMARTGPCFKKLTPKVSKLLL